SASGLIQNVRGPRLSVIPRKWTTNPSVCHLTIVLPPVALSAQSLFVPNAVNVQPPGEAALASTKSSVTDASTVASVAGCFGGEIRILRVLFGDESEQNAFLPFTVAGAVVPKVGDSASSVIV